MEFRKNNEKFQKKSQGLKDEIKEKVGRVLLLLLLSTINNSLMIYVPYLGS